MGPANLRVFTGNRLESLADRLAEVLRAPLSSPLAAETVVVPNQGLARWLSLRLAERLGVWANFRFPFPDELLVEAARSVAPGAADLAPFAPGVLTWRLMRHLADCADRPGWEEPRRYLAADERGVKRFQLARRLAETFELYAVFRPEMLADWERGGDPDWQAELWRALLAEGQGTHKAALLEALVARAPLLAAAGRPPGVPERVSVFGVATLASLRLRAFVALAHLTEVNLFVVHPCREYWGDLVSARDAARRRPRGAPALGAAPPGNPLLASLGRLGREFLDCLLETAGTEGEAVFVEPGEGTLLGCLQADVLGLRDRGAGAGPRTRLDPRDRSVQIHSCHGPMREVEVLHDHLLELFATLPGLRPSDVVVAAPDIEAYAPYVTAVFDAPTDPGRRIPYSLADRGARARSHVVDAFLRLLALPASRLGAAEVLDLLEIPDVRRRFSLPAEELPVIRDWVERTGIRWGVDARDRARHGLPEYGENSWRAGLDRLFLGYALPGGDRRLYRGLLPFDDVEGAEARTLGCLAAFCRRLFLAREDLGRPRALGRWAEDLAALAGDFLRPDEVGARDVQAIHRELRRLREEGVAAALAEEVDLLPVRQRLTEGLDAEGGGGGFLTGRVTFCALRPLRSVPFRVVALLGMNDGAFPRVQRPPAFDRMARSPRRGDPSLRDEDRYLFLETLLSARERLYMSYAGQSLRDGSDLPPSVVVSELLDAVEQGFEHPAGPIRDELVTRHRLQAFSPAYFEGSDRLFSYSAPDCDAACARQAGVRAERPFVPGPLPPHPDEPSVDLRLLAGFLAHPARFFVNRRLGVRLEEEAWGLEEEEPFDVEGLARYELVQALATQGLEGVDPEQSLALLRARGALPPGGPGEVLYRALADEVAGFVARVRPHVAGPPREPVALDLSLETGRITGTLSGIWPSGMVRYRMANLKTRDLVRCWVEHLALVAADPARHAETVLLARDQGCRFRAVADGPARLAHLVELYRQGLREPLRFFPETSLAYVASAGAAGEALAAARAAWEGAPRRPGEGDDPYHRLCFGGSVPLGEAFERLSAEILTPLLAHREAL